MVKSIWVRHAEIMREDAFHAERTKLERAAGRWLGVVGRARRFNVGLEPEQRLLCCAQPVEIGGTSQTDICCSLALSRIKVEMANQVG